MSDYMDIFPTESELTTKLGVHVCSEENCDSVFKTSPQLAMHLVKHHKVGKLGSPTKKNNARYFCPVDNCIYNNKSTGYKYFSQNRLLKQHYMKVHGEKRYECEKCSGKFSIQSMYLRHINECGSIFSCQVCGWNYNTKGNLVLHLSRKHPLLHRLYKDNQYMISQPSNQNKSSLACSDKIPISENKNNCYAIPTNKEYNQCLNFQKPNLDLLSIKEVENRNLPLIVKNFVSVADTNNTTSIGLGENISHQIQTTVTNYVLIPMVNLFTNSAFQDNSKCDTKLVLDKKTKQKNKSMPESGSAKVSKKATKKKQSKRKQQMIKDVVSTDESSVSSFNQDQFTQTTLKTVPKDKDSETQKFNVETQTSTLKGGVPRDKIKIDKSTNLSLENHKRTSATQTHRSVLHKKIPANNKCCDINLRITKNDLVSKHQKMKPAKGKQKSTSNKEDDAKFNFSEEKREFFNNLNISLRNKTTQNSEKEVQSVEQSDLCEIDQPVNDRPISLNELTAPNNPSNFDSSDISSQFIYRDLMYDKCAGNSSTIETQTALDELLYSNRWKHDSILFSDLTCLSDIQTQTTWPSDRTEMENGFFNENCMNTDMGTLSDNVKYSECENVLISTETQTNNNILDFTTKVPLFEETRNESPDFSFKETQTCDCFADAMNFDYDYGNLQSNSFTSTFHSKNCCRGLLNRKSDVLLSCSSSETQTYLTDHIVDKNLNNESP